jgi:hypothetical protein
VKNLKSNSSSKNWVQALQFGMLIIINRAGASCVEKNTHLLFQAGKDQVFLLFWGGKEIGLLIKRFHNPQIYDSKRWKPHKFVAG